jgi:hypothetical protein
LKWKSSCSPYFGFALPDRRPEDSDYTVDVLTRCSVTKDNNGKKTMKVVPLKARGEPVVVSLPLSQVIYFAHFTAADHFISLLSCPFANDGVQLNKTD